ncbi:hypothetical protein BKD09_27190 [Bradyrhizobium japonicum]|uniref:DUF3616 domain-containing protein n=1 Tax=Bradyrhizobium japonicum TaxID=375 RepID=A0A1L3FFD4_BRAJP|nr:DUF3616 domain-containing protein [Bradyrhizobium japonicum]APG12027.1 hypothetical protein BKD09_27190 [Bradyrhizobium japonicum]
MSKPILRAGALSVAVFSLSVVLPCMSLAGSVKWSKMDIASPLTDDDGQRSTDISGISCLPASDGKRVCLVIDDQGRLAQAATIEGSKLRGGGKIRVLGKGAPPDDIVGKEPTVINCSKQKDKFKDLDGEAVAHYGKSFYVVGSHGCSRKSNKFRASSFIIAQISDDAVVMAADADPKTVDDKGTVATTFRLSEALLLSPSVRDSFTKDLMTDDGLNIEGLAVVGGTLYVGLRAPIVGTKSYLVAIDAALLFDGGRTITTGDVREVDVDLGGRGVRDIAVLSDDRLLVLSGPAQAQSLSFALHVVDPKVKSASLVAELKEIPSDWKAEAVQILRQEPSALELLVMFDGAESGEPRRYEIDLK